MVMAVMAEVTWSGGSMSWWVVESVRVRVVRRAVRRPRARLSMSMRSASSWVLSQWARACSRRL